MRLGYGSSGKTFRYTHHRAALAVDEKKSIKQLFKHAFITMPQNIAKPIAIGILLSGVISYWLPDDFFVYTQHSPWLSMLCMAFAGIPIYICSAASVPLALVFLQSGLSPGATLVFLIMGPATNMATLTTLLDQFGKKITLVYILTLLAAPYQAYSFTSFHHTSHLMRYIA